MGAPWIWRLRQPMESPLGRSGSTRQLVGLFCALSWMGLMFLNCSIVTEVTSSPAWFLIVRSVGGATYVTSMEMVVVYTVPETSVAVMV